MLADRSDDNPSTRLDPPVLLAACLSDIRKARQAYQVVKDILVERSAYDRADMAILGRQDGGAKKILRKFDLAAPIGRSLGDGWGPASGLAISVYPGALDGTGLLSGRPGERAGFSELATRTRLSVAWPDFARIGSALDDCDACLVVSAPQDLSMTIENALAGARVTTVATDLDLVSTENAIATAMSSGGRARSQTNEQIA